MPALVTEKAVTRIVRAAREVPATSVEVGDVVTYALRVRNAGMGPAFGVSLADVMPPGLTYLGPTTAVWAGGSSSGDPTGLPGAALAWPLSATLAPGDQIVLTFDVSVSGPIRQGQTYTNTLLRNRRRRRWHADPG